MVDAASRYYRVPRHVVHLAAGLLGAITLVLLLGLSIWLRGLAEFLILPERLPDRADAIVVLGGGGIVGNREARAAALYRAGLAPVVVTTGGPVLGGEAPATYSEWAVQRLVRRGVPREAVRPTGEGQSRLGDARGTRRVAEREGWRRIVLVTDDWHTRRTFLIFENVFRDTPVELYVAPAPNPDVDIATWWADEGSVLYIVGEYIKLAAYMMAANE